MSYSEAANKARRAKEAADTAASHSGTDYAQRQLAEAVAHLSSAIKELAETMHRAS